MGHFYAIQGLYVLKKLVEAVVGTTVSFFSELFVSNENLIIGVNIRDSVGKSILSLGGEVSYDIGENSRTSFITLIGFPVVRLNQLNHDFSNLEEIIFRVTGDNHKKA